MRARHLLKREPGDSRRRIPVPARRGEGTSNAAPAYAGVIPAEAGNALGRPGGEMEGTGKGDAER
jgi:hypothetical protein